MDDADEETNDNVLQNLLYVIRVEGWDTGKVSEVLGYQGGAEYFSNLLAKKRKGDPRRKRENKSRLKPYQRKHFAHALDLDESTLVLPPAEFIQRYTLLSKRIVTSFACTRGRQHDEWGEAAKEHAGDFVVYFRRPSEPSPVVAARLSIGQRERHGIAVTFAIPFSGLDDDAIADNVVDYKYAGLLLPLDKSLYIFSEEVADDRCIELLTIVLHDRRHPKKHFLRGWMLGIEAEEERPGAVPVVARFAGDADGKGREKKRGELFGEFHDRDPKVPPKVLKLLASEAAKLEGLVQRTSSETPAPAARVTASKKNRKRSKNVAGCYLLRPLDDLQRRGECVKLP